MVDRLWRGIRGFVRHVARSAYPQHRAKVDGSGLGNAAQGHATNSTQRLGHGSIEITLKTYAHVLPSDDATLAEGLERMYG